MSRPTTEMLDTYFEELSHVDKEAERTWYRAGIAAYTHLCSPASEQWKKEHGFMEDCTMTRDEKMMNAAEAYAAGLYADEPVSFSTEEDRCVTMNDFCAGWYAADRCSRWIPVEEYPKVDISCTLLVHYVDGTIDICDYYGDFYDYTGENVTRNVTHWMEIQPPRKED